MSGLAALHGAVVLILRGHLSGLSTLHGAVVLTLRGHLSGLAALHGAVVPALEGHLSGLAALHGGIHLFLPGRHRAGLVCLVTVFGKGNGGNRQKGYCQHYGKNPFHRMFPPLNSFG